MGRELRYAAPTAPALEPLREASDLAGTLLATPVASACVDLHLDTPGRALGRAGYLCRLREEGGAWRATLVRLGAVEGALHEHEAIDGPASGVADPTAWPESPMRERVLALAGDATLEELFTLRQARVTRRLGPLGAPVADLRIDEVKVDRTTEPFFEIEVEERRRGSGDPSDLLARVGAALESLGLEPESRTRHERALALTRPKRPAIRAEEPLAEAARKAIALHTARLFYHEAEARRGDVESVHRMRVATRRMRAALRLFGAAFRRKTVRTLDAGLRTTARTLGAVRDFDVLLQHARTADAPGLALLLDEWEAQRATTRDALAEYLSGAEYAAFAEQLGAFAGSAGAGARRGADAPAQQVRYVAGALVWERYQAVRAYEPFVRWGPLETLHALRIDAKYLRYTLEFLGEVLGPETPNLIETMVTLQNHLGELHDAEVTAALLRDHLARHPDPGRSITDYLLVRERELRRLQRGAPRLLARVASATFRRRLARAIAAL